MEIITAITSDGNLTKLNLSDILFLEYQNKTGVIFQTPNQQAYLPGTLVQWVSVLQNEGIELYVADRHVALNPHKVEKFDSTLKIAYFTNGKRCTIAMHKYNELIKILGGMKIDFSLV